MFCVRRKDARAAEQVKSVEKRRAGKGGKEMRKEVLERRAAEVRLARRSRRQR